MSSKDYQIDLLRHGETVAGKVYLGVTDAPLNAQGWQQMWQAVDSHEYWQSIITSPLKRCSEFAERLASKLSIPLTIDARFQEMDFGDWDGLSADAILASDREGLSRFWQDPLQYSPPGGETLPTVVKRVMDAWEEVVAKKQRQLLITHGGPMRVLLCVQQRLPIAQLMNIPVAHAQLNALLNPVANSDFIFSEKKIKQ